MNLKIEDPIKKEVCSACGNPADGFRCDACGVETKKFDENHVCGARHLVMKCAECGEPETKCTCPVRPV